MTVRMAPLIMAMALAAFSGCGKADQPSPSESVMTPPSAKPGMPPAVAQPRVETAVVEFSPSHQALVLSGKVAYGEDRYSKISSPLQGRVVEVRAHLGDRVKTGDVLLIVDSPDIAQAYSEYVKEDSDLQYATRAHDLQPLRRGAEADNWWQRAVGTGTALHPCGDLALGQRARAAEREDDGDHRQALERGLEERVEALPEFDHRIIHTKVAKSAKAEAKVPMRVILSGAKDPCIRATARIRVDSSLPPSPRLRRTSRSE